MEDPVNINSGRPFGKTAKEYIKKGFHPIPLPKRKKFPPPTGWTGRDAPPVTHKQANEWFAEGADEGNVGLHMYDVMDEAGDPLMIPDPEGGECSATLIGIDVDHYDDKTGGDTLRHLERKYGELPPTWTSSSRNDGVSGIRYYLAPARLEYSGKVGESIECIQRKHRFAVVYPSWHPKGGQYVWYPPGCAPQGVPCAYTPPGKVTRSISEQADGLVEFRFKHRSGVSGASGTEDDAVEVYGTDIPNAWDMPLLPVSWIEYLSKGFQDSTSSPIDMDTSVDDIYKWARKTFRQKGGSRKATLESALEELEEIGCSQMKRRVADMVDTILNSSDSHDPLKDSHWELFSMAREGHSGWMSGVRVMENTFMDHVMGNDGSAQKRGLEEATKEMFRSRTNALRKIKAKIEKDTKDRLGEEALASGKLSGVMLKCACYEGDTDEIGGDEFGDVDLSSASDPGKYEQNDDGNAEHFLDLLDGRIFFVEGYDKWVFWDGQNWRWDEKGFARRAFRMVKRRQKAYATQLYNEVFAAIAAGEDDGKIKELKAKAKSWNEWATRSGNNNNAKNALLAAQANGVTVSSDVPDGNPSLLGVENGVIELNSESAFFRKANKDDWVVSNTGVPYLRRQDMIQAGGDLRAGVELFDSYLEKFQPDLETRQWLQQIMGMCLLGKNQEKKFIFLLGQSHTGKSTLLNLIMHALGQYSGSAELSIFGNHKLNPMLAQALPWRVLTTTEANASGDALSADMLKRLTGNDPMTAELKNSNEAVVRVPAFVPIVATNDPPHVEGYDDAMRQRFEIIPFKVAQPPGEAPVDIEQEMIDKALPAVLAWLIDGWNMYCQHRLKNRPASLGEARDEFEREIAGEIGIFIDEMMDKNDYRTISSKDIDLDKCLSANENWRAYVHWCNINGIPEAKRFTKPVLGRRMKKAGYQSVPVNVGPGPNVRYYPGLKVKTKLAKVVVNLKDKES